MRYFIIETMGDDQDRKLAFIDSPPEDIGIYDYCLSKGERIGDRYPKEARIQLEPKSPGIKLSSLIGNTQSFLIVNTEMKDVILEYGRGEMEILPFTLFNHKKRLHSKDYWIINPIGWNDCINEAASDISYSSRGTGEIVAVKKFVLDPKKLEGAPDLFRIPEDEYKYFVSERLAKAFLEHGFTNVFLTEVEVMEAS